MCLPGEYRRAEMRRISPRMERKKERRREYSGNGNCERIILIPGGNFVSRRELSSDNEFILLGWINGEFCSYFTVFTVLSG
jgi:hypothetical protein